jgi:hypothetical protein
MKSTRTRMPWQGFAGNAAVMYVCMYVCMCEDSQADMNMIRESMIHTVFLLLHAHVFMETRIMRTRLS